MSIEVRCPNPLCDKVHSVKNKYAGKRGQCPDCGTWMQVPPLAAPAPVHQPTDNAPAWVSEEAPAAAAPRPARAQADRGAAFRGQPDPAESAPVELLPEERAPRKPPAPREPVFDAEVLDEEEVIEEAELEEEGTQPAAAELGWVPVILVFLGVLSLGAFSLAPFLPKTAAERPNPQMPTYKFGYEDVPILGGDIAQLGVIVPGGFALVALIALGLLMATRRFNFLSQFLLYLTSIACVAFLAMAGLGFRGEERKVALLETLAKNKPNYTITRGYTFPVAAGASAAAVFFFGLAVLLMHRRWGNRVVFLAVLLIAGALGAVAVFADKVGLDILTS